MLEAGSGQKSHGGPREASIGKQAIKKCEVCKSRPSAQGITIVLLFIVLFLRPRRAEQKLEPSAQILHTGAIKSLTAQTTLWQ